MKLLKYPRKPDGEIIIDNYIERPTLQCCHCGKHWLYKPGEGKKERGLCLKCLRPTCGSKECMECRPYNISR